MGHQHARALRAAQELVGGDEDGVEPRRRDRPGACRWARRARRRRSRRRPAPPPRGGRGPRPATSVRSAGHVGGGREGADHERPPARGAGPGVAGRRGRRCPRESRATSTTSAMRLQPGQLVGVVLVGADQDHRALAPAGRGAESRYSRSSGSGMRRPSRPTSLFTAAVAPLPVKRTTSSGPAFTRPCDGGAGLLAQPVHHPAGGGDRGVGVGVQGAERVHAALDEVEVAAGGGQVGVVEEARPERGGDARPAPAPRPRGGAPPRSWKVDMCAVLARPAGGTRNGHFRSVPDGSQNLCTPPVRW